MGETSIGWLLFFLFGGDISTVKAVEAGCKHSKVFRGTLIFIMSLVGVFLLLVMAIMSH
jgi:hypothetical protein